MQFTKISKTKKQKQKSRSLSLFYLKSLVR